MVRIGETWSALFSPTHEPYDVRYRGRQAKPFGSSQNGLGDDALSDALKKRRLMVMARKFLPMVIARSSNVESMWSKGCQPKERLCL